MGTISKIFTQFAKKAPDSTKGVSTAAKNLAAIQKQNTINSAIVKGVKEEVDTFTKSLLAQNAALLKKL